MLDEMILETPVTAMKEKEADLQASEKDKSKRGLFLTKAVAKWSEESHEPTLNNISVHLTPGKIVAIIGPVGSGKVKGCYKMKRNVNN
jgi:ABC-type multidrug transport system fused ATPase/permease subunit